MEFDGRTTGGTMTISYYVSQSALKARYGKNVGNQFLPMCVAAKWIDQATNQAQDCNTNPRPDGGWLGVALDPSTGRFTGGTSQALCGPDGYYWGIISSYQDKLDASNPIVTGFNGPTNIGQNFRTFVISLPSGWDVRCGG